MADRSFINPTHEGADAFWKHWRENGDPHKHGYYESTWGAINAALAKSGVCWSSDMSAAPRDGTMILLWNPLWEQTWGWQQGYFNEELNGWICSSDNTWVEETEPTHWYHVSEPSQQDHRG